MGATVAHDLVCADAEPPSVRARPEPRRVRWFSSGVASAIATLLDLKAHPGGVIARCDTGSEDEDNDRFMADCEPLFGQPVLMLRNPDFANIDEVFEKRRYMSGIAGAPCTMETKVTPRLAFQQDDDIHVFGYTADQRDVARFEAFATNYPCVTIVAPLIERGITKAGCLAILQTLGIEPPRTYALGFPNANCIGCVKATSPDYWALVRLHYPEVFARRARLSREIGCRLARINDERVFIDEIPADQPVTNPIAPACDFLCHIAGKDLAA